MWRKGCLPPRRRHWASPGQKLDPTASPAPPDPAPVTRGGRPAHSEFRLPPALRTHAPPRAGRGLALSCGSSPSSSPARLVGAGRSAPARPGVGGASRPLPPLPRRARAHPAGAEPSAPARSRQSRWAAAAGWRAVALGTAGPSLLGPRPTPFATATRGGRPRPSPPLPSGRPAGAAAVTRERRRRSQDVADGHVRDLR